ncbi:MAG: peptide chain release factor N(5)-glutamine methyltransferase [Gammaproteobacteria bacterium]|nr:peptide chain release factor N(5)-glutamine methyltransferase [Gammaproteobacteria bacterium]
MQSPTLRAVLHSATARLAAQHDSARLDAELLLAAALGQSRSYLIAWPERVLTDAQAQGFAALLARREAGEPIAHILGRREFWSLDIEVTPATLIPRPETELLVELALARIPVDTAWDIVDLGTGSGAIALAVAQERPRSRVLATDVSMEALTVAQENARRLNIGNVDFRLSAWYAGLDDARRFDVILSNPPYVRTDDPHLHQGDVRFDPIEALVSGADGLNDLRIIVAGAPTQLRPGGWLLVEHGYDQGEDVRRLFAEAGFVDIQSVADLAGHPRVTLGRAVAAQTP